MNPLFRDELSLPIRGLSQRTTRRETLRPGQPLVLFDESGPGCLLHWWLTYSPASPDLGQPDNAHRIRLKVYYDGSETPSIDMPLARFFALFFDHPIYPVESAAVKVLPRNSLNCYFPMPFQRLRLELLNESDADRGIWFMADWQSYPADHALTPLRLTATHRQEFPAEPAGSFLLADLSGQGFIAGLVKGVRVRDTSDAWYHTGGDLWLLDGEGAPRAMRGIGGEDLFNFSFGIHDYQDPYLGVPLKQPTPSGPGPGQLATGGLGVMYRFFTPDPIFFDHSAIIRFGSKANDLESVVYAYLAPSQPQPPAPLSVEQWRCAGPVECRTFEQFQSTQWAEHPTSEWPEQTTADFGLYLNDEQPTRFPVPIVQHSEHTWCDFARLYRGRKRTNNGTQPTDVSAVAIGTLNIPKPGRYRLHLGFDDWLTLWINNAQVFQSRHDQGFAVATIDHDFRQGPAEIRLKLSNKNNLQWRLWSFSFRAERIG